MAFIFPEDKNDFRAPNGVVYRWDGFKWVVKSFRSQDDFLVTLDDNPPDEPKEGDLWFDTKADELTLYLYTGSEWVPASPPVSLDGIQSQIDNALITQDDLLGRVAAGEVKQRQIELALEELSVTKGSVARYTVTETHIGAAIRNGELYVSSPNAADVQAISFAPFDVNGQPTRPANTGDIIEFVETTRAVGEVTRYRIIDGGDSQALVVEYISGNNDFAKGENEEVYIYPQNEEGVSKEYVDGLDDQNVKKAGSTMTGDLKFDGGDRNIQIDQGNRLRVVAKDSSNGGRTFLDIQTSNSNGTEGTDSGYRIKIYHLATPTAPMHAANMQYVDNQVSGAVDGLASEQYVDDAISALPSAPDLSEYAKKTFAEDLSFRPANLRWMFQGKDLGNTQPEDGKFKFDGKFIRCSFKTFNGVDLSVGLVGDTGPVSLNDGPVGIIWYKDANLKWKMKQQFRINSWRWNYNGHFEFARSSKNPDNDSSAFSVGATYYITVGGFF